MGDGIGDVAKSWLADPPWQKVFKHTFDVVTISSTFVFVSDAAAEKARAFVPPKIKGLIHNTSSSSLSGVYTMA
jgi:hypothetical protein